MSLPSFAFLQQDGKHALVLGAGYVDLYGDFEDSGRSGFIPSIGYYYGRDNKFYAMGDVHFFKEKYRSTWFSSRSANFSIGYNYFSIDNLSIAGFGGLGFYLPKARREISGVISETESKLVFGINLGVDAWLKLNDRYGFGFRWHYHNPFDSKQEVGPELSGHYTILSTYLSRSF